jgi:hypothetical protein
MCWFAKSTSRGINRGGALRTGVEPTGTGARLAGTGKHCALDTDARTTGAGEHNTSTGNLCAAVTGDTSARRTGARARRADACTGARCSGTVREALAQMRLREQSACLSTQLG